MTPQSLREWATVVTRDILSPVIGLGLSGYLAVTKQIEVFHVPLLLSLIGVPLVGRGDPTAEPDPAAGPPTPDTPPALPPAPPT